MRAYRSVAATCIDPYSKSSLDVPETASLADFADAPAQGRARARRRGGVRNQHVKAAPKHSIQPLLGLPVPGVPLERARDRELAELVTDHVLGDQHRHVLASVVHGDR